MAISDIITLACVLLLAPVAWLAGAALAAI
jgi:hypothetical protein